MSALFSYVGPNRESLLPEFFVAIRKAFAVMSACETCGAAFTLSRLDGGGYLLLDVRREVHNLRDFQSRQGESVNVLANLEDCGQVCCAHKGRERCREGYHRMLEEEEQKLRSI